MKHTKGAVAILGMVVATVTLIPMAPSGAAVKVGQSCKTVGQVSGTLVCTKKGTKLVFQVAPATTAATAAAPATTVAAAPGAPTTVAAAAAPLPVLPVDPKAKPGGNLTYITSGEAASIDPLRIPGGGTAGFDRAAAIFDTLLRIDKNGNVQPQLAAGVSSPDLGKNWILKLRPNVKFTDGTPLNADAVMFNIQRELDAKATYAAAVQIGDITGMTKVDDLTVQFTLARPIGSFPIAFTDQSGLIGSPAAIKADPAAFGSSKPIGAGPMMMKEWIRDDHMDMVKNPGYFNKDRILLDSIHVRPVTDGVARGQALLTGQADIVYALVDTQATVNGNKGVYVWGGVSTGGYFLIPNEQKKPGSDKRIREAFALMMEPAKVNQAVYSGAWRDQKLDCPPFTKSSPECVQNLWPAPDIDRARALVNSYKADGNSVDFNFLNTPIFSVQGDFMVQAMKNIGLNPRVTSLSGTEWLLAINSGAFDTAVYARSAFPTPFPYVNVFFESKARNLPKANIPDLDAALVQGSDGATANLRLAGYQNFQRVMARDFVVTWLGPWFGGFALRDNLNPSDQVFTENVRLAEMYFTS